MSWYRVQLTAAQVSTDEHVRIQSRFEQFFTAMRPPPRDMAMFSDSFSDNDVLSLYFSPATVEEAEVFIRLIGAQPCDRPPPDVALLVGHSDALQRFRQGQL